MLLGQRRHRQLGMPLNGSHRLRQSPVPRPRVLGQRQRAGVDDEVRRARLVGDHRGQHRNADVARLASADQQHRPIVKHVVAGPRLGDAGEVAYRRHRRRRADADPAHRNPHGREPLAEPHHHQTLRFPDLRRLLAVRGPIRVSRVAEDAVEEDAAFFPELFGDFQRVGRFRVHAGSVIAAVHFEPGVQPRATQRLGGGEIVHHHAQAGAGLFGDAPGVGQVRRVERERPGDVGESRGGERLRLDQRRYRDARRTVAQLALAQLETLVGLDVRPQRDAEVLGALGHADDVALHHVEMEEERGRFEVAVGRRLLSHRAGGREPRPSGSA